MNSRTIILLAAAATAVSLPLAGEAQSYYGHSGGASYYSHQRGDFYGRRRAGFRGYPEFRHIEANIRSEINDGIAQDLLAPEDAADFTQQLQVIRARELQEYRAHGWNLPDFDRSDIRSQLDALDRLVDQTRDEP